MSTVSRNRRRQLRRGTARRMKGGYYGAAAIGTAAAVSGTAAAYEWLKWREAQRERDAAQNSQWVRDVININIHDDNNDNGDFWPHEQNDYVEPPPPSMLEEPWDDDSGMIYDDDDE